MPVRARKLTARTAALMKAYLVCSMWNRKSHCGTESLTISKVRASKHVECMCCGTMKRHIVNGRDSVGTQLQYYCLVCSLVVSRFAVARASRMTFFQVCGV